MSSPATIYGSFSDQYTSLSGTGMVVGQEVYEENTGITRKLLQAGAAIANNKAFKIDETQTTSSVVIPSAAAGDFVTGVSQDAAATITSGNFFWGRIRGDVTVLVAAGVSAGDFLAASGTSGTLAAGSAANVENTNIVLRADSGAGGATAAYIR